MTTRSRNCGAAPGSWRPDEGSLTAINAIVGAFYAAFDNRDGSLPDGVRLRALFTSDATITRVSPAGLECWTADDFIAPRLLILTDGTLTQFHEWETAAETDIGLSIAGRSSVYCKSGMKGGMEVNGGGRKLISFRKIDDHWAIHAVLWEDDVA